MFTSIGYEDRFYFSHRLSSYKVSNHYLLLAIGNPFMRIFLLILFFFTYQAHALPTLIHNIKGYSIENNKLQQFDSILFDNGIILATGNKEDIAKEVSFSIQIDGKGKTLLPGLIDAHGHILGLGLNLVRVDVRGIESQSETIAAVKQYAKDNPHLRWIEGRGWNQVLWPNQEFPDRYSLDVAIQDRPVWLRRIDGHAGWANSKALELAGIDKNTADPKGGKIHRDTRGEATGILIDTAMDLVESHIPELNPLERQTALEYAFDHLISLGITSVHDAGIDFATYKQLIAMSKDNQIPLRVYAMLSGNDKHIETMLKLGKLEEPFLHIQSVKLYSDGALGSRGAALLEPYTDAPDNKGLSLTTSKQLANDLSLITKYDFQANIHAIGDAANRLVLETIAELPKDKSAKVLRHRIEHAQVVNIDDIGRFAQLGLIASMQPTHATSDMNMAENRLGKERLQGAYAWRKMLQNNVVIASGSDFPVELANPFLGLHAAVTRQSTENVPEGGWLPDQRLSVEEALKSFTTDAAFASFWENEIGSLQKGKKADFILIDQDIFTIKPQNIWKTQVLETWINGQKLYAK